jgi:hypothetical protein
MIQETYDNRDNLEMFQFHVWHEGVGQWGAYILLPDRARYIILYVLNRHFHESLSLVE